MRLESLNVETWFQKFHFCELFTFLLLRTSIDFHYKSDTSFLTLVKVFVHDSVHTTAIKYKKKIKEKNITHSVPNWLWMYCMCN